MNEQKQIDFVVEKLKEHEWDKEPNEQVFEYKSYKCTILKVPKLLHLCGYVDIPKGHKLHGIDFMSHKCAYDLSVHCGITYNCFQNDGTYRIGFDCGHLYDLIPEIE